MFEWTRTFHPAPGLLQQPADRRRPPCVERKVLWMVAAGSDRPHQWQDSSRPADLAWMRGIASELSVELGIDLEVAPPGPDHPLADRLHPGRRQGLFSGGRQVGLMGEPHPSVLRAFKLKSRPVWLEIEAEALLAEGAPPAWSELPVAQPIVRALAFSLPHRLEAGDLAAVLHANGPDGLERVGIVDLFRHDEGGQSRRAVTYELQFSGDPPRTAEEINAAVESLSRAVLETFGPAGVRQR
jgi:phenylalanyl-tRNA synthetase beta chain